MSTPPIGHHYKCDHCGRAIAERKKCFRCSRILCGMCADSRGGLLYCPRCYSPEKQPKGNKHEKKLLALTEQDVKEVW
ncbi:hypothetical protein HYS54_00980 [Candidatus Micrarchaeota archaeon]|nr:hypothetical protein [Candidatus Micrarchaeota archaeon]